jgi:hypothetical protein
LSAGKFYILRNCGDIPRVIVPVMQSYVLAGHFHWHQRLVRAIKENALIYAVGAVIGLILLIFLVAKEGIRDP